MKKKTKKQCEFAAVRVSGASHAVYDPYSLQASTTSCAKVLGRVSQLFVTTVTRQLMRARSLQTYAALRQVHTHARLNIESVQALQARVPSVTPARNRCIILLRVEQS